MKEKGNDKLVYMYVIYPNKKIRRRYGGKHLKYEESLKRCQKDACELVNNEDKKIVYNTTHNDLRQQNKERAMLNKINGKVEKIYIKVHKMKSMKLTSVYISTNKTMSNRLKDMTRFVFGGKTISQQESYQCALDFVEKIKMDDTTIIDSVNIM